MKIDIKNNSNDSSLKVSGFPLEYKYIGEEENEIDLKIFIDSETLNEVDKYLGSDMNKELGGVLLGDVFVNEDKKHFILIDNLIIAKHSNSSLSRLTFTHDTWDYINEIRERDFPNKKILGWFHSHPGHTVFLSNFDIFIQENFFDMDYMVAYVYDPTIKERGFFHWRDGKIVKSGGYYISYSESHDDFNEIISISSSEDLINLKSENKFKKKINTEYKNLLTIGLLLLTLLILLFMIYNIYEIKQKALLKDEYVKDLDEIRSENKRLTERVNDLVLDNEYRRNELMKNSDSVTGDLSGSEMNSGIPNSTKNNSLENSENKGSGRNKNEVGKIENSSLIKYKVKIGDTLEKIANQFYKNKEGINLIIKHNKLRNNADIRIGQELEIP